MRAQHGDERGASIHQYGDVVGYTAFSAGILSALGLTIASSANFEPVAQSLRCSSMTSPLRSVNIDYVNRLMEAVRSGGEFAMEKFLRVASDIGGYTPETDPYYPPDGLPGTSDEIERLEWVARGLGLKDPEAEVLFDLGKPRYTASDITRAHLLAVLEAILEGEPVDRDIWVRHDPAGAGSSLSHRR